MAGEDDQMTMSRRIQTFYRQSGGPGNKEIDRILEEHLLNGKDHGIPGRKEEVKDAFIEVFMRDRSTKPFVMGLMKIGFFLKNEWQAYLDAQRPNTEQIIEALQRAEKEGHS